MHRLELCNPLANYRTSGLDGVQLNMKFEVFSNTCLLLDCGQVKSASSSAVTSDDM